MSLSALVVERVNPSLLREGGGRGIRLFHTRSYCGSNSTRIEDMLASLLYSGIASALSTLI